MKPNSGIFVAILAAALVVGGGVRDIYGQRLGQEAEGPVGGRVTGVAGRGEEEQCARQRQDAAEDGSDVHGITSACMEWIPFGLYRHRWARG